MITVIFLGLFSPRVAPYDPLEHNVVNRFADRSWQHFGGTVKFIHYADEGHKISKLTNRIDSFTQMAMFLRDHL